MLLKVTTKKNEINGCGNPYFNKNYSHKCNTKYLRPKIDKPNLPQSEIAETD